jgi:hypothetical protein
MDNQEKDLTGKPDLLEEANVINVGLEQFFESLRKQEKQVLQVKWSPPAGGDEETIRLLDDLL